MSRGLGLTVLLVSVALVGVLMAMNMRQNGPSSQQVQRVETQGQQVSAAVNFGQAATQLELFRSENGTYAGATLDASFGVALVRADAGSYCLQAGLGTA